MAHYGADCKAFDFYNYSFECTFFLEQLYVASLRYIRRKEPHAALRTSGIHNRSRKLFRIFNGRLNYSRSANDYSFYSYKKIHCKRRKYGRPERLIYLYIFHNSLFAFFENSVCRKKHNFTTF